MPLGYATLDGFGPMFEWRSDYNRELVNEFKAKVPGSARTWNPGYSMGYRRRSQGYWEVSTSYKDTVITLCRKYGFDVTVSGNFDQPKVRQYRITLDYMGLVRHRGGELFTSSGWVEGGWNATFTLAVLQDWFKFTIGPGEMPTLFGVLGVDGSLDGVEFDKALKKAYRSAARTWHPDVNKEPEAEETFKKIQSAYEKLKDPMFRKRYNAGLELQKRVERKSSVIGDNTIKWRPPVRCGNLIVNATKVISKYEIEKILDWQPIRRPDGTVMVTYWLPGDNTFSTKWVEGE